MATPSAVCASTRVLALVATGWMSSAIAQPEYEIQPLAIDGQANSTGQGISESGAFVTGTSNSDAVRWTESGGTVLLPMLSSPSRPFSLAQDVNDNGVVVGTGATTFFGSSPLPIMWDSSGTVSQLPLPAGETLGRAFGVNNDGTVVGSVDGGSLEQAAVFTTVLGSVLTQTMPNGGVLRTAYAINGAGRIVGQALNPNNAAVTNGFYLDSGDSEATDIGALTSLGHNSAIAFAVSSDGRIAGSSSLNSGADARPFVWTESGGMIEVPLLAGTSTGGARGINASGWAVGTMSSATSIVFVYDGTQTYALEDLITTDEDWDLTGGTSNGAFGIADDGTITGRGLYNGEITGFVATLVSSCAADVNGDGMLTPTDFTAWINAFNNSLPQCDQNSDGACTPTDFTAWIANYNAGC
ncbi:MAG: hypothetical protein Phyf2KO_16840 [Phycisphaerales bacterium]